MLKCAFLCEFLRKTVKKLKKNNVFANENKNKDDNKNSRRIKNIFFAVYTCKKKHYRVLDQLGESIRRQLKPSDLFSLPFGKQVV